MNDIVTSALHYSVSNGKISFYIYVSAITYIMQLPPGKYVLTSLAFNFITDYPLSREKYTET